MNDTEMERQRKQAAGGRRRKGLTVFRLKVVGAVLMALSVASTTLVPLLFGAITADNMTALTAAVVCEAASWVAVPIYAWLLFDGWRHTHDMRWYALRLCAVAALAEPAYDRLTAGRWFDLRVQNPVWGLLVALIVLVVLDRLRVRYVGAMWWAAAAAVVVAGVLWDLLLHVGVRQRVMPVGVLTLAFVLVFRFLAPRENAMMFTAGLLGAVMCITPAVGVAILHYRNGELGYRGHGGRAWAAWVFAALYPLMLWVGCLL
ncbi:TraX family protein [Bifidobacterium parmae]|uniref:ABC transporter permease n=1 Tax=Bifidobacterium parmae TaxID=361854 RepID=A0A2N5J354_9BIFI|nr:TraX family protein [Bifidobacterium parmae]PLS28655.1 ABC transporter permease [Bifidobacterium parmae]